MSPLNQQTLRKCVILLVVINLFVGSMVGLERTILPIIGEERFGLASMSAALSCRQHLFGY